VGKSTSIEMDYDWQNSMNDGAIIAHVFLGLRGIWRAATCGACVAIKSGKNWGMLNFFFFFFF